MSSEFDEAFVRALLAEYTHIQRGDCKRKLKSGNDPNFPGWSATAITKFNTLKDEIGFPLTISSIKEASARVDASGKNLKRFYDDLHIFFALLKTNCDTNEIEGFDGLHDHIKERFHARRDIDDKKVRRLTDKQEEAWLDMPEVMFRTQMTILYASIEPGSVERSYKHIETDLLQQLFISAFHILEGLPRRLEELSYLKWKQDAEDPRSNYIEDLDKGVIIVNRHKSGGYDTEKLSNLRMHLSTSLPLLRELYRRCESENAYVLPNSYRSPSRTAKYTAAFHAATGRHISMNTLRHICATALTKSYYNTRRNADQFIQQSMGHSVQTQTKYYIHHEKIEDRSPERESSVSSNAFSDDDAGEELELDEEDTDPSISNHSVNHQESEEEIEVNDYPKVTEPEQKDKKKRYKPTDLEIATLTQLGRKWKPKLTAKERMSIHSLLTDQEIIEANGMSAAHNLNTFGGESITQAQRIEKLRNYVRTSEDFQPENKLASLKARVRAGAAKQQAKRRTEASSVHSDSSGDPC